ncbi:MAG: DUF4249 domain-containing protein [Williamsia sp.]|nr:DUF4249 domain-containing protein [Williamsia sp.]
MRPLLRKVSTCLLVLSVLTGLVSCEKSVTFKLNEAANQLVVEATIENGQPPVVTLSNSYSYFSTITRELLLNSFVHGAQIVVSDGTRAQTLKEYAYKVAGNDIYYYTIDSTQLSNTFVGELNKAYTLQIKSNGSTYQAATTIPPLSKKIDSLWWIKSVNNPDTNKVILMSKLTDPPGYGNYMRYYTKTNRGPYLPGLNSVYDDQVIDGTTYNVQVDKGVDRNQNIDFEDYGFFNIGDTVVVKLSNIDKTTYDFWRTMEYSYSSIGNPFSSPTKVLGNIQGGALGYFGGYASQFKSIILKR